MRRRGEGGFQRAGSLGAAGAGLPKALTRKLELEAAWREIAGPMLAARVRAVQIRQGVLELGIEDPAWARQVVPLLPLLASKLARKAPGLGVRKFRISVAGEIRVPPTIPPADDSESAAIDAQPPRPPAPSAEKPGDTTGDRSRRVAEIAERYLAAVGLRRPPSTRA